MQIIDGFSEISDRYDAILCDVWGVIRDGHRLLPEAMDTLARFRADGGTVVLVSNAPRPADDLARQLAAMGAGTDSWDGIVTSGDTTRAALKERAPGPVFRLGPDERDEALFEGLELDFVALEAASFVACTGLVDDLNEDPGDYISLLETMKARDLEMVCANPDIVVQWGDRLVWCAGALARMYEKMGGRTIVSGKPHAPIYDLAENTLSELGFDGKRDRILAIGDGPETDLAGAEGRGIDALFIAGGILGESLDSEGLSEAGLRTALDEYGVLPRWAAQSLRWS